jgi:hypothetical protein
MKNFNLAILLLFSPIFLNAQLPAPEVDFNKSYWAPSHPQTGAQNKVIM